MESISIPATAIHSLDDEPRILDTDLAVWLGYQAPFQIRELISRNSEELQSYGNLSCRTINSGQRGRPAQAYYLNEGQALVLCALSRTDRAAQVRKALITVFMDFRAGKFVAVKAHNRRPPYASRESSFDGPYPFRLLQMAQGGLCELTLTLPLADAVAILRGREISAD